MADAAMQGAVVRLIVSRRSLTATTSCESALVLRWVRVKSALRARKSLLLAASVVSEGPSTLVAWSRMCIDLLSRQLLFSWTRQYGVLFDISCVTRSESSESVSTVAGSGRSFPQLPVPITLVVPTKVPVNLVIGLSLQVPAERPVADLLPQGLRTRLDSLSEGVDQRPNLDSQVQRARRRRRRQS